MPTITCAGVVVVDVVCRTVDTLPPAGQLQSIENMEMVVGGNAANVSAAFSALGGRAHLVACTGNDPLGVFLSKSLSASGVDIARVRSCREASTASTVVLVDSSGERSFLHVPGANRCLGLDDLLGGLSGASDALVVAGVGLLPGLHGQPLARAMAAARARGLLTVIDTVLSPGMLGQDAIAEALPSTDWLVPSAVETAEITGVSDIQAQLDCLIDLGASGIVLKQGERGCVVRTPDGVIGSVAAFPVHCCDLLGAGDSWVAGFVRGLLEGCEPMQAALLANRVAADSVSGPGCTAGLLGWDHVFQRSRRDLA